MSQQKSYIFMLTAILTYLSVCNGVHDIWHHNVRDETMSLTGNKLSCDKV